MNELGIRTLKGMLSKAYDKTRNAEEKHIIEKAIEDWDRELIKKNGKKRKNRK